MKYKVIGWTEYDNFEVQAAPCSESALQAIIADIKQNGYVFTGYDHQESMNGAPVLNDGKKRLFSQRSFGGVMARAHGDFSRMGYAYYAFQWDRGWDDEDCGILLPPAERSFSPYDFVPEENLNEEFIYSVDKEAFEQAKKGQLKLADSPELIFLDAGDTLTLVCGTEKRSFLVKEFERRRDLSDEDQIEIMALAYTFDEEKTKLANEKFESAPWILELVLE